MRISLFRQDTFEGLVIAMSDAAEEAVRKRSSNTVAWNKLGRRNGTETARESDTASDGSSSDQEATAPADLGPEERSTTSAQNDLELTISTPAPSTDPVPTETPSSALADDLPPVTTASPTAEILDQSPTPVAEPTTLLSAVIETPSATPEPSTTAPPPPAATSGLALEISTPASPTQVPLTTEVASPPPSTSSLVIEPSTSISGTIASTTEVAPIVAATSATALAGISVSSPIIDPLVSAESLAPVVTQISSLADSTTKSVLAPSSEVSTSAAPPPAKSTISLPPALAPLTDTHTSTLPLPTILPPESLSAASAKPSKTATLPESSTSDEDPSDASSVDSFPGASLLQTRPSSFVTSITPTQVADSLPSSQLPGIPDVSGTGSGSGSGSGKVGGTGGNDITGSNGGAITQTSADHAGADRTTAAVGVTFLILGSLALLGGIVYLIRRVLRQRRLGKAYSPPSSPLLNAINDPLPSGIVRSMSERSVMETGRSEFWSSSDSSTMMGVVVGEHREKLSGSEDGMGYRADISMGSFWKSLDMGEGWNEHLVIPPLSLLPPVADPVGARVEKVDGMMFEMIGDTSFGINEKPLGGHGPLG